MQAFLRFLLYLLSFTIGVLLIVLGGFPELRDEFLRIYAERLLSTPGQVASVALGIVLVLIPIAIAFRGWAARRYAREISYATESGRVSVSLVAIEEALTRAVEQEDVVRKVHVRVTEDRVRRLVVVEAALTLWDDEDITTANKRCQEILSRRFRELMPERAMQVHLNVHRLNHRRPGDEHDSRRHVVAERSSDDERETDAAELLPGLATTHGEVDNAAGATLLANRKETRGREGTRGDDEAASEPAEAGDGDADSDQGADSEDDEDYQNLYVGPTYPVDDDEHDDYSGRPLPVK